MQKHFYIAIFFLLLVMVAEAQVFTKTLAKRYGGSKSEYDGPGGGIWGYPPVSFDGCLVQSDVGPDTCFFFTSGSQSKDFYVHGSKGESDIWIVKTKPNGDTLFTRTFGSHNRDFPFGIRALADKGCVVTGLHTDADFDFAGTGPFASGISAFLIRLDSVGNLVYNKHLGGSEQDRLHGLIQTADKGFLMCGYTESKDGTLSTAIDTTGYGWMVKTDSVGQVQWNTKVAWKDTLPATRRETLFRAVELPGSQGYIFGGTATLNYNDATKNDFFMVRLAATGQVMWKQKFGGVKLDYLIGMTQLTSGNIVVAGRSRNAVSNLIDDFWMRCLDVDGAIVWDKKVIGDFAPKVFDILPFQGNRILLAGSLHNSGVASLPIVTGQAGWLAVLDSIGNFQASLAADGNSGDIFESIRYLPGSRNEVLVTGVSESDPNFWCPGPKFGQTGDVDAWLLRIKIIDTATVGTQPLVTEPGMLLYPQPASNSFSILYHALPQEAVLIDIRGRVVRRFTVEELQTNVYEVAGLAPGLYTLHLHMATGPVYKRLVVE